ncbi:adenylate and guanylate cyclase catalytic domain containing protein [Nitzschia inconspicua]|uniref:Adenylate and guanylate cyclase catalytic domain containing protein n=1 Tax=Nitzschia inconspicua TaxID=303405 RepID=A0A9K3LY29_9STRA|nr:adenylate and guanylate cyclase catalytic domain containing protein [Nitzschia inconspicua]
MASATTPQGKRLRGGSFSPEGSKSTTTATAATTTPKLPFPLVSNCSQYTQKLPTQETYEALLRAYRIARNNPKAALGKFHTENAQIRFGKDNNKNNGRGMYATHTLEKGEMIYESATTITTFQTEESYVQFLTQLEPSLQCDALLWSYSTDDRVIIALDENCCVNHGGKDMNIGYQYGGSYFANRRIEKDEEILDNYSNYMSFNAIEWFERIRRNAWGGNDELYSAPDAVTIIQDDTIEANLYLRQGVVQPILEKNPDANEDNNNIIVGIKVANPVFCHSSSTENQTGAIVDSMFPKGIRQGLMNDQEANKDSKKGQHFGLPFIGSHQKALIPGAYSSSLPLVLTTKPIADYYPSSTLIVTDLVGFTAWSSKRKPAQVFTFLETLFNAFGNVAKKRKDFQGGNYSFVQTVGNLYNDNSFHNFAHACHVTQATIKLLSRIVTPDQIDTTTLTYKIEKDASTLHACTYGITSDPII